MQQLEYIESICHHFFFVFVFEFFVAFLFFNHFGQSIYDPLRFRLIL